MTCSEGLLLLGLELDAPWIGGIDSRKFSVRPDQRGPLITDDRFCDSSAW